jgi:glutathionylspermidine synthase
MPRHDWIGELERLGLTFHADYWVEDICYVLSAAEAEELERASNELHRLCLETAGAIIAGRRYRELKIPPTAIPLIEASWAHADPPLYGRFDFRFGDGSPPKLLEYNADTPTSLVESSLFQWQWAEGQGPETDQFNRIHAALLSRLAELRQQFPDGLHMASLDDPEDLLTVSYLLEVACQAGFDCSQLTMDQIGWSASPGRFIGKEGEHIQAMFKLYPWEWMMRDPFSSFLPLASIHWLEPPWKMLLSNKAFLKILWERNPGHPNLLETVDQPGNLTAFVRKPYLSREGGNVSLIRDGRKLESNAGEYGSGGFIDQELALLPEFDSVHPVIGSWIVGDVACGIGIRESDGLITNNRSRFVPHRID